MAGEISRRARLRDVAVVVHGENRCQVLHRDIPLAAVLAHHIGHPRHLVLYLHFRLRPQFSVLLLEQGGDVRKHLPLIIGDNGKLQGTAGVITRLFQERDGLLRIVGAHGVQIHIALHVHRHHGRQWFGQAELGLFGDLLPVGAVAPDGFADAQVIEGRPGHLQQRRHGGRLQAPQHRNVFALPQPPRQLGRHGVQHIDLASLQGRDLANGVI